mmetsp:Transcript_26092/g.71873  ORF Transcript_26092/g.71873 Transcript_26092/m.71873 type:complete len:109 (-) Transcript_26092:243-569(-)
MRPHICGFPAVAPFFNQVEKVAANCQVLSKANVSAVMDHKYFSFFLEGQIQFSMSPISLEVIRGKNAYEEKAIANMRLYFGFPQIRSLDAHSVKEGGNTLMIQLPRQK